MSEKHASEGGVFVRLANNGDKVTGAFCGEPYARELLWDGQKYIPYDAKDPAHRGEGKKPSLRVALNFFVPAENAMKIIEVGAQTFRDILRCRGKYGLDTWTFEIERHGEAGNAKTKYSVLPDTKLDDSLRAKIARAELHDLERMVGQSGDGAAEAPRKALAPAPATDGAIDAATAADLIGRLKLLQRADVDAFLAALGVQRVRDLRAADVPKAKALLAKYDGPADGPEEIDPFA